MDKRLAALTLVLAALSSGGVSGGGQDRAETTTIKVVTRFCRFPVMFGGRSYILEPTRQEIDGSPKWDPGSDGEPPVPVGQAVRLASDEFSRHFKGAEDWVMSSVMLAPMCEGNWVWTVGWQPKDRGVVGTMMLPVLMSGVVVPLDRLKEP